MRRLIVGFDPGLNITGYGVIDAGGVRPVLIEGGAIRPTKKPLADRLKHLYESAAEIVREFQPVAVAIEELFSHYERPKTAVLMGHARGVLVLAAAQAGVAVESYLPTKVKKTMTGNGHATKEQMQLALRTEFGLADLAAPADVADAFAVALCHYHLAERRLTRTG